MTRLTTAAAAAALIAGSPALAHTTTAIHVHETDHASLLLGLVLISVGLGAGVLIRHRSK